MLKSTTAHGRQTSLAIPLAPTYRDAVAALRAGIATLLGKLALERKRCAGQAAAARQRRIIALGHEIGGMLTALAKARGESGRMRRRQRRAFASERRRDTRKRLEGFRELRLASGQAMRRQLAEHMATLRGWRSEFRRIRQGRPASVGGPEERRGHRQLAGSKSNTKRKAGAKW